MVSGPRFRRKTATLYPGKNLYPEYPEGPLRRNSDPVLRITGARKIDSGINPTDDYDNTNHSRPQVVLFSFSTFFQPFVTVHALSRAWTVTCENPIPNRYAMRFSPLYSGFSRKAREKLLAFQVGLYSNSLFPSPFPGFFRAFSYAVTAFSASISFSGSFVRAAGSTSAPYSPNRALALARSSASSTSHHMLSGTSTMRTSHSRR